MSAGAVEAPEADLSSVLEAVAAGDREAFAALYRQAGPMVFGICMRIVRDRENARDAFQEAMVRIWQKAHLFDRSKCGGLGWIAVVTRNCVFNRITDHRQTVASLEDEAIRAVVEAKWATTSLPLADVRRCLEKLSERYRKCILLTYYFGLSYEELSQRMAAPLGTVKVWIHRAIGALGACLGR